MDTGIYFISSVDIKLQNHLAHFAFKFMNSTGMNGEVGEWNVSSCIFAFYGTSRSQIRFGEALAMLKRRQAQETPSAYLTFFI